MTQQAKQAAAIIAERKKNFTPQLGIILGSGLSAVADSIQDPTHISYADLPGFPETSVKGHAGILTLGHLNDCPVICLQGRGHTYETNNYDSVKNYIRTLKLCGCRYLLATNAAGSLREDVGPGELVLITDHINMQPGNPLAGPNDDDFGPRFPALDSAYHPMLQEILLQTAKERDINLHKGIYIAVLGPSFETAAEIRAFKILGADVVGMSTVPEVIVANHCGLKVAVISSVTNFATGLATESHDHNNVLASAKKSAKHLATLIHAFAKSLIC